MPADMYLNDESVVAQTMKEVGTSLNKQERCQLRFGLRNYDNIVWAVGLGYGGLSFLAEILQEKPEKFYRAVTQLRRAGFLEKH